MSKSGARRSLSVQILGALVIVSTAALLSLLLVGQNAISMADRNAMARQERLAVRALSAEIARLPEQQRSAATWDEAIYRTRSLDYDWIDANLGSWMQSYFGHNESYILDGSNKAVFASVGGDRLPPSVFEGRAAAIAPLVEEFRAFVGTLDEASEGTDLEQGEVSVVEPVKFADKAALVSIVPIISDTGNVPQPPGTEALHVAVRYIGPEFARQIGEPIELKNVSFAAEIAADQTGIPLADSEGNVISWLLWEPDRPGMALLMRLLPVLAVCGLVSSVLIWWVASRLIRVSQQLHVSEAQARFLAHHDVLTGLPNRALFQESLTQALHAADRTGEPLAVVAIDLDNFKHVNDTLGHPAGDELIRQVGSRLSAVIRAGDTVARFGGDEFLVLLPNMGDDNALHRVCAKIIDELSHPFVLLGAFKSIGASAGAVRAVSADQDQSDILRRADTALYNAKLTGKNRYCLFEDDLTRTAENRNQLENDLRAALSAEGELRVVYQPVHDADGKITGAEALCRWDHPSLGALSPEIFIRVAEERGLIHDLGRWMLEKSCSFAARSQLERISVNVSPLQLRNDDFVPMVLEILESTGLAPGRLELELTEKVVLERSKQIHRTLVRLRTTGIRIALDDFATGNSSLQYLRDHHVDCVKIDRTFVARLGEDQECNDLVEAIIRMAHAMRISVTVEGVETEKQRRILKGMGCKAFQGYALNAPMEHAQLVDLLSDGDGDGQRIQVTAG